MVGTAVKLVASMIVRNELGRYLEQSVGHLLEYVDELRILDDASTDGTSEWLTEVHDERMKVKRLDQSGFYEHEGRTRQRLLDWTLEADPTYILAIDADEFVADPQMVRAACTGTTPVWTLSMEEVWELDGDCLCIREDGGWRSHPVAILWWPQGGVEWSIRDTALACGRVPHVVGRQHGAPPTGTEVLHFGWANEGERERRHQRYVAHDQGRYHAGHHLDSIMWRDERVELRGREWPAALEKRRGGIATFAAARDA